MQWVLGTLDFASMENASVAAEWGIHFSLRYTGHAYLINSSFLVSRFKYLYQIIHAIPTS